MAGVHDRSEHADEGDEADESVARFRQDVLDHRPADAREVESCRLMIESLDRLRHPFDRFADPTHVTASAIIVGPRGVILHLHRRLGRWLQPGGHLEPRERPDQAVLRECAEETGLPAVHPAGGPLLIHVDVHRAADDHVHLDPRYLLLAPDVEPAPAPGESREVAWFTWEEAAALADTALSGALRSARRVVHAREVGWDREDM